MIATKSLMEKNTRRNLPRRARLKKSPKMTRKSPRTAKRKKIRLVRNLMSLAVMRRTQTLQLPPTMRKMPSLKPKTQENIFPTQKGVQKQDLRVTRASNWVNLMTRVVTRYA